MPNLLVELSREDLLAQATRLVERAHPTQRPVHVQAFLRDYYRHLPAEELAERQPEEVAGVALTHRQLAAARAAATANVHVFTPTLASHGWSTGHSVLDVVVEDMPFLVDSITVELARQQRPVHLIVHPVLRVRRDVTGTLREVIPEGQEPTTEDDALVVTESWMHVEFERETGEAGLAQVEQAVRRVLQDVAAAVEDYRRMQARMVEAAEAVVSRPLPVPAREVGEAEELLRWLAGDHFTFLGYREYRLERVDGQDVLRPVTGTGLGLLRYDKGPSQAFATLPEAVRAKARERAVLVLTKANSRSTVHRDTYLDYVGVKVFGDGERADEVVGERRFLGLFASTAYHESVRRIPLLRSKVDQVIEASGFAPGSHRAKDLQQVLETYPRDELFQISVERLTEIAMALVGLQDRRQVRLFVRPDDYGRFLSCLVYLPQERMSTHVRLRITDILLRATGGETVDYAVRIGEAVLARLHLVIRMPAGQQLPELDLGLLEHELSAAVRSWDDELRAALVDQVGEEEASRLLRRYGGAFSDGYKEDFTPRLAVADLQQLEQLGESELAVNLYQQPVSAPNERRFKLYRTGSALTLTEVLPVLTDLGVTVVDEWPYDIDRSPPDAGGEQGIGRAFLYDFGLRYDGPDLTGDLGVKERFERAFTAVWEGAEQSDGLNRLVLLAGLDHRQCGVLRSYAKYLRQTGSTFSPAYVEEALLAHPHLARRLIDLFSTRFDPRLPGADGAPISFDGRRDAVETIVAELTADLDAVASLDHDRILRSLMGLIQATLRTNHFTPDPVGEDGTTRAKAYLSLKLDPRQVPELPEPRPFGEIWVSSPLVEGVHLRFGKVARGGLRWSDRREDFRTEVLGLVKAQAVKNAVIVPVGAKGGFVLRQPPDPELGRAALLEAGVAAYRVFVRGMLEVTDTRRTGPDGDVTVETPADVVRWDDEDPYLVVAADKGTATFSDIANEISLDMGFWLGDAFASGGSAGYDHKAMGITARGAWESVRRHFRGMGRNTQTADVTCVGIGDMSGDVFGNAMLLSEHLRLVAAFDHRHVFLDPDPDAATSFAERTRLFGLERSSWADYDADLISAGGGVWSRTAKSVPISPQVRAVLGLDDDVGALTPSGVISAILAAPVDLLFNGGVGTYVRASSETNLDVGDKSNDAVRVEASDVRARVVGEGGNLGLTQRARVQLARAGVRVNTDAIDNAAGVDTSDHEVNLKILLDAAVREGDLTGKQRNALLAGMTDEVAQLVLRHNYRQTATLELAVAEAPSMATVHGAYLRSLERRGLIDRELERLPTERELRERRAAGEGLTAPELAVLLGYTKNQLYADLLETGLPDEEVPRRLLATYFPAEVRRRFADRVAQHPLRREIVTTRLANELVDEAGVSFLYRLGLETAAGPAELCRAHLVAREVFDFAALTADIDALDNVVAADVQVAMRMAVRQVVERASRWFVLRRGSAMDAAAEIEAFDGPVNRVLEAMPELLTGDLADAADRVRERLTSAGVPDGLATRVAALPQGQAALGMAECADRLDADLLEVARVHLVVGARMGLDRLHDKVVALPRDDRWQTMARAALRDDLASLHAAMTAEVMTLTASGSPADRLAAWERQDDDALRRARVLLGDVLSEETGDLARLSVGLRAVRSVLRDGS